MNLRPVFALVCLLMPVLVAAQGQAASEPRQAASLQVQQERLRMQRSREQVKAEAEQAKAIEAFNKIEEKSLGGEKRPRANPSGMPAGH